jgi:hypothetical protein
LVFAPDGSPVAGARVQLTWPTPSGVRLESIHLGKTDKEGKFAVAIRSAVPERAVLVVSHWMYPSKHVTFVEEDHQLHKHTIRVFMDAGVRVEGRVVDTNGKLVHSGYVTLFTTRTPLLPGWEPNYMMGNMARQFGLVRLRADLKEDGTFHFDGWPQDRPGTFSMRVPGRPLELVRCPGGELDPKRNAAIFQRGQDLGQVVVRFTRTSTVTATGRIRGLGSLTTTDLLLDVGEGVSLRMPTTWNPDGGFRAHLSVSEARLAGKEVRLKFRGIAPSSGCEWGPYLISGDLILKDLSGLLR